LPLFLEGLFYCNSQWNVIGLILQPRLPFFNFTCPGDEMKYYKKMAGTSAVFVFADFQGPSPVERDGLIWTATELHLNDNLPPLRALPAMANALALEGLEDYDPPILGDIRFVSSLDASFVYWDAIRGWVQHE
jgi:hypothetical protein